MWTSLENKLINFIRDSKKDMSSEEESIIRYGMQLYYFNVSKLIILVCVSVVLNIFAETLTVFILIVLLKRYAYGFHADGFWSCLVISSINIFGIVYLSQFHIHMYIKILVIIVSLTLFALYVPADTQNRPLPDIKSRRLLKIKGLAVCCAYSVILWFVPDRLSAMMLLSMLIVGLNSSPLLYKIFRKEYKNYERFAKQR